MTWDVETEFDLMVTLKVRAKISPAEPMTMDYPGCPESIEEMEIEIYGEKITQKLQDKIYKENEDEINEVIWDDVEEAKRDRAIAQAEARLEGDR